MRAIGISASRRSAGRERLFAALGSAFGVTFTWRPVDDESALDAWVVLDAIGEGLCLPKGSVLPSYVALDASVCVHESRTSTLTFRDDPAVPRVLRGRTLTADDVADHPQLPVWLSGTTSLAEKDGMPIWAVDAEAGRQWFVAGPPPELGEREALFAHFSGTRIAQLLPLVCFILTISAEVGWEPPPLQASFMVDDPNLHWPSYGYIEYREMAARATAGNYHVSFATIPLDAWFVHRRAGALFREHAARLSLLFHGNDHVANELARSRSTAAADEMVSQAIGRIGDLEARAGISVSRVMAPPHGACSEDTIAALGRHGFDAVCVSRGSLRHHNPGAPWLATLGMGALDEIAGLTLIPRFGLTPSCANDILIAALLHQPVVPMTHHQVVAEGYALLDATADLINSLGDVEWCHMEGIARARYYRRRIGNRLDVRMLSGRVDIVVPVGVSKVAVEARMDGDEGLRPLWWRIRCPLQADWRAIGPGGAVDVAGGQTIEIATSRMLATSPATRRSSGHRAVMPVARRVLTEGRDRLLPTARRLLGRGVERRVAAS